jgi:hypothetical protein
MRIKSSRYVCDDYAVSVVILEQQEIVYMATLIAAKSAVNKMDAANIARSLAPGLMRSDVNTGDMMAVVCAKLLLVFFACLMVFFKKKSACSESRQQRLV